MDVGHQLGSEHRGLLGEDRCVDEEGIGPGGDVGDWFELGGGSECQDGIRVGFYLEGVCLFGGIGCKEVSQLYKFICPNLLSEF